MPKLKWQKIPGAVDLAKGQRYSPQQIAKFERELGLPHIHRQTPLMPYYKMRGSNSHLETINNTQTGGPL